MRRSMLLPAMLGLAALGAHSQNPTTLEWHGFVNPHYYADSRSVVGGREDMMLFYPKPVALDSTGHDLNSGWQADMLAITARLGLRIKGSDVLGAKGSAYIEGDFTGATNATIDNLRLRHAYIQLDWERHHLIVGQYWYAMVVHEIMPMTNPLNMGAPFHCYARQPQVRYSYRRQHVEAIAVAQWQLDNMSQGLLDGVQTSSTQFARHSMVPEMNAQVRFRSGGLMVGVAANVKTIQPIVPFSPLALPHSQRLHSSLSWSVYGLYRQGEISIKAQALLNNSLYEGCSMGGYILRIAQGDPTQYAVRDWHFNTMWLDVERNSGHWRPGLFAGYAHNADFGTPITTGSVTDYVMGRGFDIEYLWRVQPRLTYDTGRALSFTAEAEYTVAGYGTGIVAGAERQYVHDADAAVGNLRLSLSAVYSF